MPNRLYILDGGDATPLVKIPHIFADGAWEKTFKVHILNAGVWKESHKTLYSNYSIGTGGQAETQSDGSWTVPAKTRYIRVKIWGNGASGGGGTSTEKYYETGQTQYPLAPAYQTYASGGGGGNGAYAEVVLETKPGVTFSWTGFSSTPYLTGGTGSENMSSFYGGTDTPATGLRHIAPHTYTGWNVYETHAGATNNSKGAWHAGHGYDAPNIVFTGDSPTSGDPYILTAGGGYKGYGAVVWITAGNKTGGYLVTGLHTYTFSVSSGYSFARGVNHLGHLSNSYSSYTGSGALDFWNLSNYSYDGYYHGSATMSGNSSSFASTTLTSGGGMSGGSGGGVTLESDGAGSNERNGKNGSAGTKGKITIDTYQ